MPPCFATVSTMSAEFRLVVERDIDRIERHRLQRDAALPVLAHLGEQPATRSASASDSCRYACAARRCRARRRSAARSPCACATSSRDQFASRSAITAVRAPMMRAVRILRALPDVALVDMGVHVDEARQHDAAVEIEARQAVAARLPGRWRRCGRFSITMSQGARPSASGSSCAASATRHTGTRALARRKRVRVWRDGDEVGHLFFLRVRPSLKQFHALSRKRLIA